MKKLILAMRGPGWSGKLADTSLDEDRLRYLDNPGDRIHGVNSPVEAIELLLKLMLLYEQHPSSTSNVVDG